MVLREDACSNGTDRFGCLSLSIMFDLCAAIE